MSKLLTDKSKEESARKQYDSLYRTYPEYKCDFPSNIQDRISELSGAVRDSTKRIGTLKTEFRKELEKKHSIRTFIPEKIKDSNIISVFESTLTRTLGMQTDNLYQDIVVVRVYYYEILKDLILDGFTLNGEKYIFFTASAGQIRTKKVVFIKEKLWLQHQGTLMCGLTLDAIEAKGSTNRNKFLAYLALCNSATEEWSRFNIHKAIVVDDMETLVPGTVDYLDDVTFQITRKQMDIPIAHTDGCGMILPRVSKSNFIARLPWIKGLIASFPFDRFILEANEANPSRNHALVVDIYGQQHDVLAEGIEIIFTKSQFKLWRFYSGWNDYVQKYIENGCTAGICSVEEDYIPHSKLSYQVLQTLSDMSDDELKTLASNTVKKIESIATSRESKLEAFGATKSNRYRNDFQECLMIYPELLSTGYIKETLRQIKDHMVREGRAGKINIDGKYLFLVPDLYAFCQRLFLCDINPSGLLKDGEVYCSQYTDAEKLDCLRFPHLRKEHAVRYNLAHTNNISWFSTSGIYTSCHDLISKILMFDNDGDRSLVCADPLLIEIAERNTKDTVPLYYKMGKADPTSLSGESLYDGMILAYTGGKIGAISNDITKIWNSENPNLYAIDVLCSMTNFCIDYSKTLYKPEIPESVMQIIDPLVKVKTPHFFVYAKGKTLSQVEPINNSVVNRLESIIPNIRMKDKEVAQYKFNYEDMMNDKSVIETESLISAYDELYRKYKCVFSASKDMAPYYYIKQEAVASLSSAAGSATLACDMLIHYLFKTINSTRQKVFWLCFSDIVLANLKKNLENTLACAKCGKRIRKDASNQKLCDECREYQKASDKTLVCCDCGLEFTVHGVVKKKTRCDSCQAAYRRKCKTKKQREYRQKD